MSYTPLVFLPVLSDRLCLKVYVKREDQIDQVGCGHKLRKLNFCLNEIKACGASILITAGSLPSTQTLAVSTFAERNGLKAHVIYMGDNEVKPQRLDGPYLATCLSGPHITWFEKRPWCHVEQALEEVAQTERENGETPYVVEPGISSNRGIEASVDLGKEIFSQISVEQADVLVPVGSGGTALGLSIALRTLAERWRVHGVCIASDKLSTEKRLQYLKTQYGSDAEVDLTDESLCGGYGQFSAEWLGEARSLLNAEGILPDSTYFLKAVISLIIKTKNKYWPEGSNVILVHTGGSPHAFSAESSLAWALARQSSEWVSA